MQPKIEQERTNRSGRYARESLGITNGFWPLPHENLLTLGA